MMATTKKATTTKHRAPRAGGREHIADRTADKLAAIRAVTVTEENFADLLLQSAGEALAIARGEMKPAKTTTRTARRTAVTPPPAYDAARVRAVRERLRVSQTVFAGLLNISPSTARAWEQGTRVPDGPSRRLLEVAERHPAAVLATASERARA